MRSAVTLAFMAIALAACGKPDVPPATVEGACKAFGDHGPAITICGETRRDQQWIDEQIERGVAACGWSRPKARDVGLCAHEKKKRKK